MLSNERDLFFGCDVDDGVTVQVLRNSRLTPIVILLRQGSMHCLYIEYVCLILAAAATLVLQNAGTLASMGVRNA